MKDSLSIRTGSLGFSSTAAALTTAHEADLSGPDGNPFVGEDGCLRDLYKIYYLLLEFSQTVIGSARGNLYRTIIDSSSVRRVL